MQTLASQLSSTLMQTLALNSHQLSYKLFLLNSHKLSSTLIQTPTLNSHQLSCKLLLLTLINSHQLSYKLLVLNSRQLSCKLLLLNSYQVRCRCLFFAKENCINYNNCNISQYSNDHCDEFKYDRWKKNLAIKYMS